MGKLGDTFTAFIFFFLSIIIISTSAITIYTYNKDKKAKDVNYWWSVACLVCALIGLLISGFMFYKSGKNEYASYVAAMGSAAPAPKVVAAPAPPQPQILVAAPAA